MALCVQLLWLRWLSYTDVAETLVWLIPASYLPLGAFVWLNRARYWVWIVGVGMTLNLLAMLANGGAMPAPADLAAGTGPDAPAPSTVVRLAPGNKDRLYPGGDAQIVLPLLADRILLTLPGGSQRLASVGDFVALAGCTLALLEVVGLGPRRRRDLAADSTDETTNQATNEATNQAKEMARVPLH